MEFKIWILIVTCHVAKEMLSFIHLSLACLTASFEVLESVIFSVWWCDKIEVIWKDVIVANFELLSRHRDWNESWKILIWSCSVSVGESNTIWLYLTRKLSYIATAACKSGHQEERFVVLGRPVNSIVTACHKHVLNPKIKLLRYIVLSENI